MQRTFLMVLAFSLYAGSTAVADVGGGEVLFSPKGADKVSYSHETHVTKAGLKGSDCHYKIYNTHEASKRRTMDEMGKGVSCGACHNGSRAFDLKTNCGKCHKP